MVRILEAAEQLSTAERAELADHIVENLVRDIPPEIERLQILEVRRRIAQVKSGEVTLVPGEEALAQVRRRVASKQAES